MKGSIKLIFFLLVFLASIACIISCNQELENPKTYVISYDSNEADDGSVPENQIKAHDENVTLATNLGDLIRAGYLFAGWNTEADGSGSDYAVGASFTINANTTLYAKWRLIEVGGIGPAGGYIFFENDKYLIQGWRYLEAAPEGWSGEANDPAIAFGIHRPDGIYNLSVGTSTDIGTGKYNTGALVDAMGDEAYSGAEGDETNYYAAKLASDYCVTVGGSDYVDWFLPSKDELNEMYKNLHKQNIGGFTDFTYWSSSEISSYEVWGQSFGNGHQVKNGRSSINTSRVRPIRSF